MNECNAGKKSENQKQTSSHEESHLVRPCGETFIDNLGSKGDEKRERELLLDVGHRSAKKHTRSRIMPSTLIW